MTASAASTMPNYTGCTVDGRYELVRILGSGTYGVVYQAVDIRPSSSGDHASRAVKMIRKAGRKPSELAAARREIALHRLVSDHPNIVTVHDAYEDDDYFYIVMDLCRGGDLFEPICKRIYVDNDALLRKAFISLIDAVEACHSSRVYHRDLKPENVLLTEDNPPVVKVADFGLAKVIDSMTMLRTMCGTPLYLAPEVVNQTPDNEGYDQVVDSWSVGVIVFSM